MSENNGSRTLIGLVDILNYMQIGKPMFYQFVEMGLPARVINKRWYAHKDNIDDFFKKVTRHRAKEIPTDAE